MITSVKCPSCGTSLKLREGFAQRLKEIKCPKCSGTIPIQSGESPPASTSASTKHIAIRPIIPSGASASGAPPTAAPGTQTGAVAILVRCSGCGREITVRPDLAGKKIRCKQCGTINPVPEPSAQPTSPKPNATPTTVRVVASAAAPSASGNMADATLAAATQGGPAITQEPSPAPAAPAPTPSVAAAAPTDSPSEPQDVRGWKERAEKAELALRSLAGQHAVEKAELLHQIAQLKAELERLRGELARAQDHWKAKTEQALQAWATEERARWDSALRALRDRLTGM